MVEFIGRKGMNFGEFERKIKIKKTKNTREVVFEEIHAKKKSGSGDRKIIIIIWGTLLHFYFWVIATDR